MRRMLLAMVGLLAACSSSADLGEAQGAITRFHAQLNNGQYDAIYEAAGPEMKRASPQATTVKMFGAIISKLGPYVGGRQVGWRENYTTGGTFLVVEYDSRFQKGAAKEVFSFRKADKHVDLVGYTINSPLLITG